METAQLNEVGLKEAETIIDRCKDRIKKACEEALGEIYTDLPQWLESDAWFNFRQQLRREIAGKSYRDVLDAGDYWGLEVRNQIFEEHKDHFLKDAIISDLQKRIDMQNETIKSLSERRY